MSGRKTSKTPSAVLRIATYFWTDDHGILSKVTDVPALTVRSDSAVAERWGIGEQELNNYVLYPSFIVTRGEFKDS